MGEAARAGGLYYDPKTKKAIDSEGREIKDAPKRPADTPPGPAAAMATPEQRLGHAIVEAMRGGAPVAPKAETPKPADAK